ncbi:hypothetical protein UPYG_G00078030 [Umbra pygmaea]|uniref:Uncharacterized protein n=1 Tax=Umbra pygmaea TaxID=75934 RepID=A0ABD0XSP3_UMBPY
MRGPPLSTSSPSWRTISQPRSHSTSQGITYSRIGRSAALDPFAMQTYPSNQGGTDLHIEARGRYCFEQCASEKPTGSLVIELHKPLLSLMMKMYMLFILFLFQTLISLFCYIISGTTCISLYDFTRFFFFVFFLNFSWLKLSCFFQ